MNKPYDYRSCKSLFGYALEVHKRSGGVCQLCGCGAGQEISFDLWRQMTVEHLIGESRGGYPKQILAVLANRFPELSLEVQKRYAKRIDDANTITACSFCNSTTSWHDRHGKNMSQFLNEAQGEPDEVIDAVVLAVENIFEEKKAEVSRKIQAVHDAFEKLVKPDLLKARQVAESVI